MFEKVLIANRGEIALRIHRACREMGIQTVAVHSTADADAMHVRLADESVCIGPPPARDSYLNIPAILSAATITGADAIHPGYGFLVRERRLRRDGRGARLHLHRPDARAYPLMGDKVAAKDAARELGHPAGAGLATARSTDDAEARARSPSEIGYPVLIKAAAGGGGRGMKVAHAPRRAGARRCRMARAEAKAAFGNDAVYLEKYLDQPRHIEIQILATATATSSISASATARCSAATRRCSRKRPRRRSNADEREPHRQHRASRRCAQLGYRSAGTIEFLYQDGEFYFIEMNTRLQVEHPVTEMITRHRPGARADPHRRRRAARLSARRTSRFTGHAIECRINAENPRDLRALARARSPTTTRRAASACASIPRSMPATRCRPTTTA